MSRSLIALVLFATSAAAEPLSAVAPAPSPEPRPSCDTGLYLEPSVFGSVALGSTDAMPGTSDRVSLYHRIAGGAELHACHPDGTRGIGARLGVTADAVILHSFDVGVGIEAELDHPASALGIRLGYDVLTEGRIATAGMRYRPGTWSLAVDYFHGGDGPRDGNGLMFGIGVDGRPGRYAALGEGAVVSVGLVVLLAVALVHPSFSGWPL